MGNPPTTTTTGVTAARAGPTTTAGTTGVRAGLTYNHGDDSCGCRTNPHTTTVGMTAMMGDLPTVGTMAAMAGLTDPLLTRTMGMMGAGARLTHPPQPWE